MADNSGEVFDFEVQVARKTFNQFKLSNIKENMKSVIIHIENSTSFTWDKVLTKHYGPPLDKQTNGLHWKVKNYSDGQGVIKGCSAVALIRGTYRNIGGKEDFAKGKGRKICL